MSLKTKPRSILDLPISKNTRENSGIYVPQHRVPLQLRRSICFSLWTPLGSTWTLSLPASQTRGVWSQASIYQSPVRAVTSRHLQDTHAGFMACRQWHASGAIQPKTSRYSTPRNFAGPHGQFWGCDTGKPCSNRHIGTLVTTSRLDPFPGEGTSSTLDSS